MKPVEFEGANLVLRKPAGMTDEECGDLHVHTDGKVCQSVWSLDEAEANAVARSRMIRVWVHSGYTQPPIALGAIEPSKDDPEPGRERMYRVNAEIYLTKLGALCAAIRRRGIEVGNVGLSDGWDDECEPVVSALASRRSLWARLRSWFGGAR